MDVRDLLNFEEEETIKLFGNGILVEIQIIVPLPYNLLIDAYIKSDTKR